MNADDQTSTMGRLALALEALSGMRRASLHVPPRPGEDAETEADRVLCGEGWHRWCNEFYCVACGRPWIDAPHGTIGGDRLAAGVPPAESWQDRGGVSVTGPVRSTAPAPRGTEAP